MIKTYQKRIISQELFKVNRNKAETIDVKRKQQLKPFWLTLLKA
jgi:hypothetical protein